MEIKDLKINFRYLVGNIACLSVDSIDGKSIHNDINNEEAIIIFNSLIGEKENCQTVKKLLQENQELKEKLDKYENPKDMTLFAMWCTEKVKDENQELKLELSGYRQAILNNKEMLGLKEQNEKLKKQLEERPKEYVFIGNAQNKTRDFINQNVKENKELKKQVEEIDRKLFFTKNELDMRQKSIDNKLNQQKEFINYLEKEIKRINPNDLYIGELNLRLDDIKFTQYLIYKEILQKYREIIGVSNENTIK